MVEVKEGRGAGGGDETVRGQGRALPRGLLNLEKTVARSLGRFNAKQRQGETETGVPGSAGLLIKSDTPYRCGISIASASIRLQVDADPTALSPAPPESHIHVPDDCLGSAGGRA